MLRSINMDLNTAPSFVSFLFGESEKPGNHRCQSEWNGPAHELMKTPMLQYFGTRPEIKMISIPRIIFASISSVRDGGEFL